jgi:sarcosine oxidase subunit gamma
VPEPLALSSALEAVARAGRFGSREGEPGVVISERVGLGLASVLTRKGCGAALAERLRILYGINVADAPHVSVGAQLSLVGVGPQRWLAVSDALRGETLAADLAAKLQGLASVSDQSGGRTLVRLSGPAARDVLAKGLAIDLHPRAFAPGSAATANVGHVDVQIWQVDEAPTYDIAVFGSLAESFWRWLTASAAAFGYRVGMD